MEETLRINLATAGFLTVKTFLEQQIIFWLSVKLSCSIEQLDPKTAFIDFNLDSIATAQMLNVLEKFTNCSLEIYLTKDYKTIAELAAYLANMITTGSKPVDTSAKKSYDEYLNPRKADSEEDIVLPDYIE